MEAALPRHPLEEKPLYEGRRLERLSYDGVWLLKVFHDEGGKKGKPPLLDELRPHSHHDVRYGDIVGTALPAGAAEDTLGDMFQDGIGQLHLPPQVGVGKRDLSPCACRLPLYDTKGRTDAPAGTAPDTPGYIIRKIFQYFHANWIVTADCSGCR